MENFLLELFVLATQLVLGLGLSMGAIYLALKLYDRSTKNLDEWKEMKKGNIAVGILLGAIVISIGIIVEGGVSNITKNVEIGATITVIFVTLLVGLVNLLISVIAAVVCVFVTIKLLDLIAIDLNEIDELKKGNISVAILLGAILITVSFVIRGAVGGILDVINATEIIRLLGL